MPIRITDSNGFSNASLIAQGIIWAVDHGAKVINLSICTNIPGDSTVDSAAKYVMSKGGLVVAAAGNTSGLIAASSDPYIIWVSATNWNDILATFSSYGPYVDLSAPGLTIYTTYDPIQGTEYGSVAGTSFSSPIVAGVASLMFSVNPSLTPSQVRSILESTAKDLGTSGWDQYYGWGRVDAGAAVKAAAAGAPPPPPADTTAPTASITSPLSGSTLSGIVNVSNAGPTPDTTPPTVTITSPSNGSVLPQPKATISASGSDNVGVYEIDLYFDSVLRNSCFNTTFCSVNVNVKRISSGTHTITAKASDASGNTGTATITVTK